MNVHRKSALHFLSCFGLWVVTCACCLVIKIPSKPLCTTKQPAKKILLIFFVYFLMHGEQNYRTVHFIANKFLL